MKPGRNETDYNSPGSLRQVKSNNNELAETLRLVNIAYLIDILSILHSRFRGYPEMCYNIQSIAYSIIIRRPHYATRGIYRLGLGMVCCT